ncbi:MULTISPECIES: substrate-binding periplasmic protein [unclassified Pseudoalteromonas]|uniref:substrate-binding periplasmic protein n=1 Tax=unclassified Pseudoalteromonas TaxID=194690 RepID=UPI0030157A9F
MKQILILGLLTISCLVCASEKPQLRYSLSGSGSFQPYYTHQQQAPGILVEIVQAILVTTKIDGENLLLPAKRTNYYLENKLIDFDIISLDWLNEKQRKDARFIYSDPLLEVNEYVVTRTPTRPLSSLYGLEVGTVRGYYYHDDEQFKRVDFASEKELLQALHRGRVEQIIIGDLPALYWAKKLNIRFSFNYKHSQGKLRLRLLAKHQNLLANINQAIAQLQASGLIASIEQRYRHAL